MRTFLSLLLFGAAAFANHDYKLKLGSAYQNHVVVKPSNDTYQADVRARFDYSYENDDGDMKFTLNSDALWDNQDSLRRYLYINEAKLTYYGDTFDIHAGNLITSWGVMDIFSPVDIFNHRNLLKDPLANSKLGSLGLWYTHYLDMSKLEFYVKFVETMQTIPYHASPYNFIDKSVAFVEDFSNVTLWRPTLYARFVSTLDMPTFSLDYSVVVSNGFDNIRGVQDKGFDGTHYTLAPLLFHATKIMQTVLLPYENFLFKQEGVVGISEDSRVSHYMQLALGVEYATSGWFDSSINYIVEYHRFHRLDESKLSSMQLMQFFQNDVALGMRMGFNDMHNSALFVGALIDVDKNGAALQARLNSKFDDHVGYSVEFLHTYAHKTYSTSYTNGATFDTMYGSFYGAMGDFTALRFVLTYDF